jgi:hypothetical protein
LRINLRLRRFLLPILRRRRGLKAMYGSPRYNGRYRAARYFKLPDYPEMHEVCKSGSQANALQASAG